MSGGTCTSGLVEKIGRRAKHSTSSEKVEESWGLEGSRYREHTQAAAALLRPCCAVGKMRLLLFSAAVSAAWAVCTWALQKGSPSGTPSTPHTPLEKGTSEAGF